MDIYGRNPSVWDMGKSRSRLRAESCYEAGGQKSGEGSGELIDWLRRSREGYKEMIDWGDWDVYASTLTEMCDTE